MSRTSDLISAMTFLGIQHDPKKDYIDLRAWPKETTTKFVSDLDEKFNREGESSDVEESVQKYFSQHINAVIQALSLTALTAADDDLLIMKSGKDHYVYFGGITDTLVYISCWMVVPNKHQINPDIKPQILFWFLNTLYVGQLNGLEKTTVDANRIEEAIDDTRIPVYTRS